MVTLFGEGEKRGKLKLAVVELIVGKDQRARGANANVGYAGKGKPIYLKRPLQKLYPLEIQAQSGSKRKVGNPPVTRTERILQERVMYTKRLAAVNSREKTRAMPHSWTFMNQGGWGAVGSQRSAVSCLLSGYFWTRLCKYCK